jgi:hypothetical protein
MKNKRATVTTYYSDGTTREEEAEMTGSGLTGEKYYRGVDSGNIYQV